MVSTLLQGCDLILVDLVGLHQGHFDSNSLFDIPMWLRDIPRSIIQKLRKIWSE